MSIASYPPFTPLGNMTAQPAASIPLAWSKVGLPIGVQFVARFGDEATLLRLTVEFEAVRRWVSRRPSVRPD